MNLPLVTLPCLFEGDERLDWDRESAKMPYRRRWYDCRHPRTPLGPFNPVTPSMGCDPTCPGYQADRAYEKTLYGVAPLLVRELSCLLPADPRPAFNGSIFRYRGVLLLAYRRGPVCHVAELEEGTYRCLSDRVIGILHERAALRQEDPRLWDFRGRLYMSFAGVERDLDPANETGLKASILYALLDPDNDYQPVEVYYPHYPDRTLWEKNWGFFEYAGQLYAVYSIKPHQILRIHHDTATLAYETPTPHAWTGGHLRGGAPPVEVADKFLHVFHGRIGVGTEAVYNMGAYLFESRPPFAVHYMTRNPIMWADPDSRVRPDEQASVVFPAGVLREGHNLIVSYGFNDSAIHAATYDINSITPTLRGHPVSLPPVYAITCDELPERQQALREECGKHNVSPRLWKAIHGNTWGLQTSKVYTEGECPITPGHAALTLTHYQLWQHLWESGVEDAIILEDDVILCDDFARKATALIARLPDTVDFVFLGHTGCCPEKVRSWLLDDVAETGAVYGTHCYYVRRQALPTLLARMKELRSHVDLQLWENVLEKRHIRWYTAVPALAGQRTAEGQWPGSLGGSFWPGIPGDLRAAIAAADAHVAGWCPPEKARQMAALVLATKPKVVVEVGVYGGKSYLPMVLAMRHLHQHGGHEGIVWGVDPWTYEACDEGWKEADKPEHKDHRDWWQTRSDLVNQAAKLAAWLSAHECWPFARLLMARGEDVADVFTQQPIDILHIDGNHATVSAVRDVRTYVPRVKTGGWIWADDVSWETVKPAVRELESRCRLVLDCGNWRLYRKE